ncbi:hypothetical protein [Streptococcus marimammalium]|nr:hypothetical protein [Streptococcus marimammalium]
MDRPYISFNRIVEVTILNEYKEKFGEYVYYGYGFPIRTWQMIGAS